MTHEEYTAVWTATEKAAAYLRKKGAQYVTDSVPSGFQEYRLIRWTFADVAEKARAHVEKVYPLALVAFDEPRAVEQEIRRRDEAFFRAACRA